MDNDPHRLNKSDVRRAFARAAASYDEAAVLQREIADRLIARLDIVKLKPTDILDAGTGTGYCARALSKRYRHAQVVGIDLAQPLAARAHRQRGWFSRRRFICGDIERLPLAKHSFDLIVSNLSLQWCDLDAAFTELLRVLRPGGLLMFTSFGPDTLRELRAAWAQADKATHVHTFIDMHDVGDALLRAGFAEPVMDVEHLTLTYATVRDALQDLKAIGAHNAAQTRARGLTGKLRYGRFVAAYEAQRQQGRIPATYEAVYGHAWAPLTERQTVRADGAVAVSLDALTRR